MFGFLDSKVTMRHLLFLGVLVAVPALGAGALAGSSSVNSLLPSGTVRMASTSSTSSVSVDGDVTKRVLHVSVNVPLHKHADFQATFSASVHHNIGTYAYCFATITLDTSPTVREVPAWPPAAAGWCHGTGAGRGLRCDDGVPHGGRRRRPHRQRVHHALVRRVPTAGACAQRAGQHLLTSSRPGVPCVCDAVGRTCPRQGFW